MGIPSSGRGRHRRMAASTLTAVLVFSSSAAGAQLVALPARIPLSNGVVTSAGLCTTSSGGLAAVWAERIASDRTVLACRLFDPSGSPLAAAVALASLHGGVTLAPTRAVTAVAPRPDGGVAVAWSGVHAPEAGSDVFVQRFDAKGAPLGSEAQVNEKVTGDQCCPAIATDALGGFVVAWQGEGVRDSAVDVFARRFDKAGQPLGSEFQVNDDAVGDQDAPDVAVVRAGGFVVSWASRERAGATTSVRARRFDAAGVPLGSEFGVGSGAHGEQDQPALVSTADGGFVVTWRSVADTDAAAKGADASIHALRFDADGLAAGSEVGLDADGSRASSQPAVTSLADGRLAVAWRGMPSSGTEHGETREGVFAGVASAAGVLESPAVFLAGDAESRLRPSIAASGERVSVVTDGSITRLTLDPICGDLDGDRVVSADDALVLLEAASGRSDCPPCLCDTDGDGTVRARDALRLARAAEQARPALNCPHR